MDVVVLPDDHGAGEPARLPTELRDALPRLFVESTMPLALIDAQGRLLAVNSGFSALTGRAATVLTGGLLADVLHEDDRDRHLSEWRALLGGVAHADRTEVRLLRPDSTVVPVVIYRTVIASGRDRADALGLAAVHDESHLHPAALTATYLETVARDLAGTTADAELLGAVVAQAGADLVGDMAWLWRRGAAGDLQLLGARHRDPARQDLMATVLSRPVTSTSGAVARAVGLARAVRLADHDLDPKREPLAATWQSYANQFGLTGMLIVPLVNADRVVGVLALARDGGAAPFDDDDVATAAALADASTATLANNSLLVNARADERLAHAVLDAIPAMAAVLDRAGRVVHVNAAWSRSSPATGSPAVGLGTNYLDVCDTAAALGLTGAMEVANGVRDVLADVRTEFAGDCVFRQEGGEEVWLHVHAARLDVPPAGELTPAVVVDHHDVTDRKLLEVRLAYEATHDPLTGLPNRTLLADRIDRALVRDRRAGVRTALLFCDLDQFKEVNDTYGHDGGDAVLRAVAQRFAGTVRASDTVARIGGDEFVVLIESVTDVDEALLVADKLVLSLREPDQPRAPHEPPLPGVSVGVAMSTPDSTADSLLREADAAMYSAKQSGRSRVQVAGNPPSTDGRS